MTHHPHVHFIVPGGGLSLDGNTWVASRPDFLVHVKVLSALFRRLFLDKLLVLYRQQRLSFFGKLKSLEHPRAFKRLIARLRHRKWYVDARAPFSGPHAVLKYLSVTPTASPSLTHDSSPSMNTTSPLNGKTTEQSRKTVTKLCPSTRLSLSDDSSSTSCPQAFIALGITDSLPMLSAHTTSTKYDDYSTSSHLRRKTTKTLSSHHHPIGCCVPLAAKPCASSMSSTPLMYRSIVGGDRRDLQALPVNLVCYGVSPTRDRPPPRVATTPLYTASAESACSTHHCIDSKPTPSHSLSTHPALHLPPSLHKITPPRPQIPIAQTSFFHASLP